MWIIVFAVIILFAYLVHVNEDVPVIKSKKAEQEEYEKEYLRANNVSISTEYAYHSSYYTDNINYNNSIAIRFIVDSQHQFIHILSKSKRTDYITETSMPFRQIIGCEIMTDSKVTGGIGRAVVGGVIAGDAGAIVGAITAPSKIMSYKIVIYKNDPNNPIEEIILVNEKKATKDPDYINAVRFAENVNAVIKAIVYQNSIVSR